MQNNDLHTKVLVAKKFLNTELVRLKTAGNAAPIHYREINDRLDLLHEVERIGYRNLSERDLRKLNKMLLALDTTIAQSLASSN